MLAVRPTTSVKKIRDARLVSLCSTTTESWVQTRDRYRSADSGLRGAQHPMMHAAHAMPVTAANFTTLPSVPTWSSSDARLGVHFLRRDSIITQFPGQRPLLRLCLY